MTSLPSFTSPTLSASLRFEGIDRQDVYNPAMAGQKVVKAKRNYIQTRNYDAEGFGERITLDYADARKFWKSQGVLGHQERSGSGCSGGSSLWGGLRQLWSERSAMKAQARTPGFFGAVESFLGVPYPASAEARKLAKSYATTSSHHLASGNDFEHFIMEDGDRKGFVGYRVVNRVAVAVGNPCGDMPIDKVLQGWLTHVRKHRWMPVILKADASIQPLAKEAGLKAIPIGAQGLVELKKFTMSGKAKQDLRSAVNRQKKEKWVIREYQESDWTEVNKLNHNWLKIHGGKEIGFPMGKPSPQYLKDTKTVVLLDKEGKLLAYMNTLDLPKSNSRTVDLMRRQADAPGGAMEALFVYQIEKAKADGLDTFDMEVSPLAKLEDMPALDSPRLVAMMKRLYNWDKVYDFKNLYKFKTKFATDWEPSLMVFRRMRDLPAITLAVLRLNQINKLLPWHTEA